MTVLIKRTLCNQLQSIKCCYLKISNRWIHALIHLFNYGLLIIVNAALVSIQDFSNIKNIFLTPNF